jgi:HK97 family phage prohead protease
MRIKTVKERKIEQAAQLFRTPGVKSHRSIFYKDMMGIAALKKKEDGEETIATGYLAAFGNIDSHKDIIHKGSFAKSIKERGPESDTPRKIAFLYTHNMAQPIGRFTKLEELEKGLYYEATLDAIPFVQGTIIPQLKSGTLNNHSIGYNYVWDKGEYDEDKDAFHWYELETFEGSLLTLGSNELTPFTGFKSFQSLDAVNDLADQANALLRGIGDYRKEFELRDVLQKYQSLLEYAAEEITAYKKKPTKIDMKYIADNFKL